MDPLGNPEANPRFQKIDKVVLLSQCPLFSGLSQWEMQSISQLMRLVEFKKGEAVYREEGDPSSFYVVVSGRFEASLTSLGKKKVLAYFHRGDYFGEMSLLNNEPHSATVMTLSDSLLLELKKDDFKKMVEHNAMISLAISRRLSARLKGPGTRSSTLLKSDVLSIFSNQHRIGRTAFTINLAASLFQETHQKTVLLDMSPSGSEISSILHMSKKIPLTQFRDIENAGPEILRNCLVRHPVGFEVLNVAHQDEDQVSERLIIPLLNHLAIDYRFILIDLPGNMDETVFKVLSQSDSIYFVTDSSLNNVTEIKEVADNIQKNLSFTDDKISVVINEVLFGMRTTTTTRRELFGRKNCYSLPATPELKTQEGSRQIPFTVEEPDAEYSRVVRHIARRVSNNLVGVALGSGAALGLAHIGVLKVLEHERIPIDFISGSSIGALIGALYAVHANAATVEQAALEINSLARLSQLLDFNLFPISGLFNGKRVMKHFKAHLGAKTFDDCRIPFRAVGSNLSARQSVVYDSGLITEAVRASIAIPAIFSPVFNKKELIVDGGILSPLPIRALQEAGVNKIIAVDVFPTPKDVLERRLLEEEAAEKEEIATRQRNWFMKAGFGMKKALARCFFPNTVDILMNTIQQMESVLAEIEGEAADIIIRPVIPTANWVEFYKPHQFIRRGEEETMKLLPKIKALVSHQNV